MTEHFTEVTETPESPVSREQIQRVYSRYEFARRYCEGRKALELACGCGIGLGHLAVDSAFVVGGDLCEGLLQHARNHYGDRLGLVRLNAQQLPFADGSFDVIVLFEAIYYLPSPEQFVEECHRVLSPGGKLIICSANKDLQDFNPSPYSNRYFNMPEMESLLRPRGFLCEWYADSSVKSSGARQKVLSFVKRLAVILNCIPKTMKSKVLLKRIVFGPLAPMPKEVCADHSCSLFPEPVLCEEKAPYKVLYVVASKA